MKTLLAVITAIITFLNPGTKTASIKPRPLDKYTIENLSQTQVKPANITIEKTLITDPKFTSYLYAMTFDPTLQNKSTKKVTGVINIPVGPKKYPVIVMFRGFVDQKLYTSGMGTKRAGEYFAQNGFITIAPDFLGYAESDKEADNVFESRFQTYTTALVTLASVSTLPEFDGTHIFIWGHSNGGQVALTLLEITGKDYPTVLWAPVSKPFPYSVLYYTDEVEDGGKYLRHELAKFEADYDTDLYSTYKYYARITATIDVHQGTADDAVPVIWSQSLVKTLKSTNPDTKIHLYPGADHNLQPAWDKAILNSLKFFEGKLIND